MPKIRRVKVSTVPAHILNYEPPRCPFCRRDIPPAPFGDMAERVVAGGAHFWCLADHDYETRTGR